MHKARLEAFSDGVIAIVITVMVLELRIPHGADVSALKETAPTLIGYVLSFVYLAIYWNNHHNMLHAAQRVNGAVLWANMHLLFWLSLVPFTTEWVGENYRRSVPVASYGVVLLLAGVAYYVLSRTLVKLHGNDSILAQAIGHDRKGLLSIIMYAAAVPCAFLHVGIAYGIYVGVAGIWLVPDRRVESRLDGNHHA